MTPVAGARYGHVTTSAFAPTDISGLQFWVDSSNAGSITSSGGAVSQWNDLSGNARHLTQATGTNQPTTGTRTQNSKNVIDFDFTNDRMSNTSWTITQPATIVIVLLVDSVTGFYKVPYDNTSAANAFTTYMNSANAIEISAGTAVNPGLSPSASTAYAWSTVFNGASSAFYNKNVIVGSTISIGSGSSTGILVGDNRALTTPWDGWIAELLVYNSALGSTDRGNLNTYLVAKWNIP